MNNNDPSPRREIGDWPLRLFVGFFLTWNVSLASALASSVPAEAPITVVPVQATVSTIVNFSELARNSKMSVPDSPPRLRSSPTTNSREEAAALEEAAPFANLPVFEQFQPLVSSPSPSVTFLGLGDIAEVGASTYVIPPDADGAVGLTEVMCGFNSNYQIQNKTNGAVVSTVSINTFWSSTGGSGFFNGRTIYDPYNNCWIVVCAANPQSTNSSICVGVSQTSNPAGTYYLFRQTVDSTGLNWADFPCAGFNQNWVAVNFDLYAVSNSVYVGVSKMLVVDYAKLRSGVYSAVVVSPTSLCSHPAATYATNLSTLYIATHWSSASGTYRLDKLTGAVDSPIYTPGTVQNRGTNWAEPSGNVLPQAAPLLGKSTCPSYPCKIEALDSQIRTAPVVRNGYIYYVQNVGLPASSMTRTAILWTKLSLPSGAVADGGFLDYPTATSTNGEWYAFPHLAVNMWGDMIIDFSQFSYTHYASSSYAVRYHTDSPGTLRSPVIYQSGLDYYHQTANNVNRWGDYNKAQVEPSNDQSFWVLTEYAAARAGTNDLNNQFNDSRWGSCWAEVTPVSCSMVCSISPASTNICETCSQTFACIPSGGSPPYTYLWNNGATSATITVDTAGTYSCVATDSSECSASAVATLAISCSITCSISPASTNICDTCSQTFICVPSGGIPPYSYLWNNGATSPSITVNAAGVYSCVVTDSIACVASAAATLTINSGAVGEPLLPPWGAGVLAMVLLGAGTAVIRSQRRYQ